MISKEMLVVVFCVCVCVCMCVCFAGVGAMASTEDIVKIVASKLQWQENCTIYVLFMLHCIEILQFTEIEEKMLPVKIELKGECPAVETGSRH